MDTPKVPHTPSRPGRQKRTFHLLSEADRSCALYTAPGGPCRSATLPVSSAPCMPGAPLPDDLTRLLLAWRDGEPGAIDRAGSPRLRRAPSAGSPPASRKRAGHTLQPTALVHEAFLRLVGQSRAQWQNREQFFAVASRAMRRVRGPRARPDGGEAGRREDPRRARRGAGPRRAPRGRHPRPRPGPRPAGGDRPTPGAGGGAPLLWRTHGPETATALDVSLATVNRDWTMARAWLFRELGGGR